MRTSFLAAIVVAATQFQASAAGRPVYLVGDATELAFIQSDVTDEIPIKTEIVDQGKWLDPARYGEAAAIVFGESAAMGAGATAWRRLETKTCWKSRHEHSTLVFDDKIWVLGGHARPLSSEVWSLWLPADWKP